MKRSTSILIYAFAIFLIAVAFITGKASASTGCFIDTNGHWAETFICWMKDNGISSGYLDGTFRPENPITRAELSVLLQKMRSTGTTQINVGAPSNWSANVVSPGAYVENYTATVHLRSAVVASSSIFQMSPDIPSSLYNSLMIFNSAKLCYITSNAAYITAVKVTHWYADATVYQTVNDPTNLTGDGCTTFSLATPGSIWGGEFVSVEVDVNFPSTSDYVTIISTTFYFTPSEFPAHPKEELRGEGEIDPASGILP